jgi:hypothetical protein
LESSIAETGVDNVVKHGPLADVDNVHSEHSPSGSQSTTTGLTSITLVMIEQKQ